MKKKNLLLITALLATLLFTACDSADNIPSESIPAQESSLGDNTASNSGVSDGDTSVQDTFSLPKVTITDHQDYQYAEDGTTVLVETDIDKVSLEGEGYEKAAQTIETLFADNAGDMEYLLSIAQDDYNYRKSSGDAYFVPYSTTSTCEIARLDQNIFSIKRWTYDYTGGAHGFGSEWGTTIDLKTGEELELIDLAVDSYALIEECTNYVLRVLSTRTDELFPEYETYISENLSNCSWYMDASGIVFVFSPYEIGPYASGCISVCVPYRQVADDMKPEYCGIQGDCIAMVQQDAEVSFITMDVTRQIAFETRPLGEYDYSTVLMVDGEEKSLGDYVRLETAYLMHNAEGKTFLLYTIDWASDDYETYVYDLTGENFIPTGNIWASINGQSLGANTLSLDFRLDVLGTYFAEMEYELTEEGMLKPLEEIFHIESRYTWSGLTTIKELPVIMNNEATTLPVGTRLYIVATDNDGIAWFETADEDGKLQSGIIRYIRDAESYRIYIDGVSEDEYFEMLPYAG